MGKPASITLGIDLGGTKMHVVVLDEKHEVIASTRRPSHGAEGPEKGMEALVEASKEALHEAGASKKKVDRVGIGCPGVVDLSSGVLKVAPNLGWKEVPVREILAKAFGAPVTVLNDVDAGTYGEYRFGAGRGARSLLGVFPGTGLGGGFIYRGHILHGKRYSCMELSDLRLSGPHLLRPGDEWPTLEDLTSRLAMTSAMMIAAYRGQAPSMAGLPLTKMKSKVIAKAVENGEQAIIDILDQGIAVLGKGIAGVVSLLGPEVIVLGGGLVERFPDRYVAGIKAQLEGWVTPDLLEGLKILPAELGDDATAKGAGAYTAVEEE